MSKMGFMDTFNDIRRWLGEMRGSFPRIAKATGLSTKTLGRIANDPEYSVTLRTLKKLQRAKATGDDEKPRAGARKKGKP